MNKVYKTVWNEQSGTWVAAPESAGRGSVGGVVRAGAVAVLLALGLPLAAHAQVSLGLGALVTGTNGIALGGLLGGGTLASGANSIALGVGGVSAGSQGISVGYGSLVSAAGVGGLALGGGTSVTGSGSIALGLGSSDGGLANVLSVGTSALQRKIINVADGTLSAVSHEVVTGAQLHATNTGQATLGAALATSLGGGATYSLLAGVSIPTYSIQGSAILGVGNALAALDASLGTNTSAIADLSVQLNLGAVGLVRQSTGTSPITVGAATGGTSVDFTGTSGARRLTGVAAGTLSAVSTQAVNGAQLFATNQQVATNTADIATHTTNIGANTTNIATNATNLSNLSQQIGNGTVGLVQQASSGQAITVGASTNGTSVNFTGTAGARQLDGVAAGTLSAGGTQAVNGGQLFSTNSQVATNTSNIGTNTSAIAALGANAVQYTNAGKGSITLGGASGTVISNVGAGTLSAVSTQAVNGAQLFATNSQVGLNTANITTNTTNIAANTSDIAGLALQINAGTAGLVQQAGAGQAITIGASTNGTSVNIAGTAGARRLDGVAAGTLSAGGTQAVNGGQLFATNQQVATNTANIATNTAGITANTADIASLGANAVQYTDAGKGTISLGGASGTVISNVAAGTLSAASTQAVNGAQLYATNQQVGANTSAVAQNTSDIAGLGTNSVQYTDSGKSLITLGGVGGTVIGNVGAGALTAGGLQAVNGGQLYATNQQVASNTASIASLSNVLVNGQGGAAQSDNTAGAAVPLATGANASAVGFGASATGAGSVALGNGSDDGGAANVVSVGSSSQKRRIVQLADGVADSDAATAGQVRTVDDKVTSLSARSVSYDVNPDQSINFASVSFGVSGTPVLLRNVAAGTLGTDAANVSQVQSVAGFLGGGAALGSNGIFAAPSFSIVQMAANGSTTTASYSNVGSAFASLNTSITNMAAHVAAANDTMAAMSTHMAGTSDGTGTTTHVTNVTNNNMMDTEYMHVNSDDPDSRAMGADSVAIGGSAVAWTDNAVAIGTGASAGGGKSVSIGYGNTAMGNGAVALGDPNVATGTGALAIGADNTATGDGAVALGNLNVATGNGAVALGNLSTANGTGAIALGNGANATVAGGVALGSGAVASRVGMSGAREAISNVAVASTQAAVSVGSAGNERQITNVAGGTEDTDAVNLRQLRASQATAVEVATQAMDAKLNTLAQGIDRVERNANAGTASAMAMSAMPQSMVPGKSMVSAGAGSFGGQAALAVGVSLLSDSGKWVAKFNGSASSRGKVGVSAGVGFQF